MKKLLIKRSENFLRPFVKIQPAVIENKALRYVFELPCKADVIVDVNANGTYSIRARPEREPRYLNLSKDRECTVINTSSRRLAMSCVDVFYKRAMLKDEAPNVFAITGEYRYLKMYLADQPHYTGHGKEYDFSFPNGYYVSIIHETDDTYSISVLDNKFKGRVNLYKVLSNVYTYDTILKGLSNREVVKMLDEIFKASPDSGPTIMDEHTLDYLKYLDIEWERDNYVMPDFEGYLQDLISNNVKDIVRGNLESYNSTLSLAL